MIEPKFVEVYTRQSEERTYPKSALREAVITLFISQDQYNPVLPGHIQAHFNEVFKKSRAIRSPFLEGLRADNSDSPAPPLVRLMNEEENFHFQYGEGLLSFHSLQPYQGFKHLSSLCQKIIRFILQSDPSLTIDGCSLLYFNIFRFDQDSVSLSDYFSINLSLPEIPNLRPSGINSFTVSTEFVYKSLERTVDIRYQSGAETDVSLSLECRPMEKPQWDADTLAEWLEISHNLLGDIFETTITEKARDFMRAKIQE